MDEVKLEARPARSGQREPAIGGNRAIKRQHPQKAKKGEITLQMQFSKDCASIF